MRPARPGQCVRKERQACVIRAIRAGITRSLLHMLRQSRSDEASGQGLFPNSVNSSPHSTQTFSGVTVAEASAGERTVDIASPFMVFGVLPGVPYASPNSPYEVHKPDQTGPNRTIEPVITGRAQVTRESRLAKNEKNNQISQKNPVRSDLHRTDQQDANRHRRSFARFRRPGQHYHPFDQRGVDAFGSQALFERCEPVLTRYQNAEGCNL